MPKTKKPTGSNSVIAEPVDADELDSDATETEVDSEATGDDDGAEDTEEVTSVSVPASDAPPARKALGAKEVIPFAWKVIGLSGEMILTLFKSVERADADTQLERLDRDGNYKELRVVPLDHKIVQPKSVKNDFVAKAFREKDESPEAKGLARKSSHKKKVDSKVVANRKSAKKAEGKAEKKSAGRKSTKDKKPGGAKAAGKKGAKSASAKKAPARKSGKKSAARKTAAKTAPRKRRTTGKKK